MHVYIPKSFPVLLLSLCLLWTSSGSAMTRTLQPDPAIVLVAFGTTTKARATYDVFEKQLRSELPEQYQSYPIEWAFTSEIVRERANRAFAEKGLNKRFLSLPQVLANLENQGYRKVVVQPLHIFPGQEYMDVQKVIAAFEQIGLRISSGGTLMHEWPWVHETLAALEPYFLAPGEGCNILAAHGTPETFAGSNTAYLGLEKYLATHYQNVFVGCVEGILPREQTMQQVLSCPTNKVRLIPFMYVAGDHIMNDIMGQEADEDGNLSWAMELQKNKFNVDIPTVSYQGETYFKGLGFYPEINQRFIEQILENIEKLEKL